MSCFLILLCVLSSGAVAQQLPPTANQPTTDQTPDQPINLVEELKLTNDQRAQIRTIRDETGTPLREAQQRRRRAQRALEEALYGERDDETMIQTRTRELSDAQADLARIRTGTEIRIRRILTPEQLGRFRELKKQRQQRRLDNFPPSAAGARQNNAGGQQRALDAQQNRRLNRERRQMERADRRGKRLNRSTPATPLQPNHR